MENYLSLCFALLTLFVFGILYFNKIRLINASYFLFGVGIATLFSLAITSDDKINLFISFASLLLVSFLITGLKKIKVTTKELIVLLFCGLTILINWDSSVTIQDYTFNIGFIHLFLIILGAATHLLTSFKIKILNKFYPNFDQAALQLSLNTLTIAIAIYLGSFFASFFGVFLVGVGGIASAFHNRNFQFPLFLLGYSILAYFIEFQNIETVDFSMGKILLGFLLGVFFILIYKTFNNSEKRNVVSNLFLILIQSFLTFLIIWLGTQKTDLGGFDAYLASLFGIITAQLFIGEMLINLLVLLISLTTGLIAAVNLKSDVVSVQQTLSLPKNLIKSDVKNEKDIDPFDIPGMSINDIIGNYKIDETTSELTFELGPKGGRTKGAIKSFSGKVNLRKSIDNSSFKVDLPVSNLTTFNSYRDETLMEDTYFNSSKFPKMNYQSKKMEQRDDYYVLSGNFEMLGNKKELEVQVKYIGKNENGAPVLIGKSSLDRTLFGMQPDPKEGNVVDFQFKIELLKIK
jgi:polyisoprenoid-binding protein YceI